MSVKGVVDGGLGATSLQVYESISLQVGSTSGMAMGENCGEGIIREGQESNIGIGIYSYRVGLLRVRLATQNSLLNYEERESGCCTNKFFCG